MAWTSIPTTSTGTKITANSIGSWFSTITSQANTIVSTHCSTHNGSHYSSHKSSVNSSNRGVWNSDGTVGSTNGRKCGGSVSPR